MNSVFNKSETGMLVACESDEAFLQTGTTNLICFAILPGTTALTWNSEH